MEVEADCPADEVPDAVQAQEERGPKGSVVNRLTGHYEYSIRLPMMKLIRLNLNH
jgi:hypothetical protein